MSEQWIAVDEERPSAAPGWARRAGRRALLAEEGIAVLQGRRIVAARWDEVLGAARVGASAYVLVPRRPPRPPWIELSPPELPDGMDGADRLVQAVGARLGARGYRSAPQPAPRRSPSELYQALLRGEEVPGAVEVPVGLGPGHRDAARRRALEAILGTVGGGFTGAYAGLYVAAFVGSAMGAIVAGGAVAGALAGGAVPALIRPRRRGRVLVLAPEGCVVGFVDGVRPLGWDEVSSFSMGLREVPDGPPGPRYCLVVTGRAGETIGAVDAEWFGEPLELIVAVAEAYRRRRRT